MDESQLPTIFVECDILHRDGVSGAFCAPPPPLKVSEISPTLRRGQSAVLASQETFEILSMHATLQSCVVRQ